MFGNIAIREKKIDNKKMHEIFYRNKLVIHRAIILNTFHLDWPEIHGHFKYCIHKSKTFPIKIVLCGVTICFSNETTRQPGNPTFQSVSQNFYAIVFQNEQLVMLVSHTFSLNQVCVCCFQVSEDYCLI